MSTTYIAVITALLAEFLPKFGITVGSEALTTTIQTIVLIGSSLWILIRRYQRGDITPLGRTR